MRRLVLLFALVFAPVATATDVLLRDNDDLPIPEPAEEKDEGSTWWNDARSLSFYQISKVADLGNWLGSREATNANTLDEVPDSTWFTNRHAAKPLSLEELRAGPAGAPPSAEGLLTIVSGKTGEAAGFVVEDDKGDRYLLKLDPPNLPEMATGAEQVSSRIVHALGWNVPAYHLVSLDRGRLALANDAEIEDEYHRKRPMTPADVDETLEKAARAADGRYRASASLFIRGTPKGPFLMEGMRPDDPNDTIPHEDRRDLRGFRVVAAWIQHTDFRPENTFDAFIAAPGRRGVGHLVHYVIDFSSTLGAADLEQKHPKAGNEYTIDPPILFANFVTFGLWVKPWEDLDVVHPAIGYFTSRSFDPEEWVTEYPNPAFDSATLRDDFWGAKLVASFTDEDVRATVDSGGWSDPRAAELLVQALIERRREIARTFFDFERINPTARFVVDERGLAFQDLAVVAGVVDPERARYRHRTSGGRWIVEAEPIASLRLRAEAEIELETSHDGGTSWSPTTKVAVTPEPSGDLRIAGIDREAR